MHETIASNIRRVLRLIVVFILTLLLIGISPILAFLLFPILIFRFVVIKYVKYFRAEFGKILSTRSAVFATDDYYGKPKANLIFIMTCKGVMNAEEFKRDYLKGVINLKGNDGQYINPELQQYLSSFCGFPFWKWDKSFNIKNHIQAYDGPISVLTQELVNEISTEYLKTPFIPGRSPWTLTIFPKCRLHSEDSDEPRTAGIVWLHHSLADGFSLIKVLSSMIPEQKIKLVLPSMPKMSPLRKIINTVGFLIVAPFEMVNSLIEAWDVNECHISERNLSPNILLAFSGRIPINYIKDIKTFHGVGFTAVLLAAFTGAVRSFMLENGYKIPRVIHSVTPFPMPGHSDKLRNYMTTCFIRLPIGLSTAEERLLAIHKNINELKSSTQPITLFYILALIGSLPSCLTQLFFKQQCPTTLISNFPGPQEQLMYLGQQLEDMMFTAGLLPGRIGIGFNAISYNGNIKIQAAFNESLAISKFPSTFMLDKVMEELKVLSEVQIH